jgi:hypothetical protein
LEDKVRLHAPKSPQITTEEYFNKLREVNRLEDEIDEKGSPRDRLILDLRDAITREPTGTLPIPVRLRALSLEEFQQFRSKIEPLSDDEIREEIRKAEEEFRQKSKEKPAPPFPSGGAVIV